MRLYSIASARDGERPNTNNLALTVKRVHERQTNGAIFRGVASNYLCDLPKGAQVSVVGPFGATFLMPDDPEVEIIMICTGTGSAPFRGFTERRRRSQPNASGRLHLFFGARTPGELPYFGPLQKVPSSILDRELVYSRLPNAPREYVQDRMRTRAADLATLLKRDSTHVFMCGLRGLETGVEACFEEIGRQHGFDWSALRGKMREAGRYHVETY
jgi:benzoyl-CoA 2,3-dioxygenase component A